MSDIFLSIIIPMYNTENYIEKALESLKNQVDKDFEIIIIDDRSSDNSYEVAQKYLENTNLIYKFIREEHLGQSVARNKGIEASKGEYILFLDSDDFIDQKLVQITKKVVKRDKCEILLFDYKRVKDEYKIINNEKLPFDYLKKIENGMEIFNAYRNKSFRLWTSSLIYKKDFIIKNNITYLANSYGAEDLNFIFKSLMKATKICCIDDVLSYYYQRKDSLTNKPDINKNITVINSFEDLCKFMINNNVDVNLQNIIKREFIPEHIMYQIFASVNEESRENVKNILNKDNVRRYLKGSKYNTPRYGRSMFIWSKIAAYFPNKFIDIYLKRK